MELKRPFNIALTLAALSLSLGVHANSYRNDVNKFDIGIAAGLSGMPYKNYSEKVIPLPFIQYENDLYFIKGAEAGVKLYSDSRNLIAASFSILPGRFKAADSDDIGVRALNDRKLVGAAGLSWSSNTRLGLFGLSLKKPITGSVRGMLVESTYGYAFTPGELLLIPTIGISYSDSDLNDHYYGISQNESSRSHLSEYKPGGGYSPFISLAAAYPITTHWNVAGEVRYTSLSKEVQDSPMVDEDYALGMMMSVSYRF